MKIQTVKIRDISLAEGRPPVIQSMTNTPTKNVEQTVAQAIRIVENGGEMVRVSVPSRADVPAMESVVEKLRRQGYGFPLIADVHFDPVIAERLAGVVDKIRVNPGNFSRESRGSSDKISERDYLVLLEQTRDRARPLIAKCKERDTALRVGVNQGSLPPRIIARYGHTPQALAQAALEWIDICENLDFSRVVFSLKASQARGMREACLLFTQEMAKRGTLYPLHIGVTEAGAGWDGRVKSAVGIGSLLLEGVGSTLRVSLTEPPENEIPFARKLLGATRSDIQNHYRIDEGILHYRHDLEDAEQWIAEVGAAAGHEHFRHALKGLHIENRHFTPGQNQALASAVEQACRIRISKTEIISCPTCARTDFDIGKVLQLVEQRFAHYPGLTLGVMGCIVNGPGEMSGADFGIVGAGNNRVVVYQGDQRISPVLPLEKGAELLEKKIEEYLEKKRS